MFSYNSWVFSWGSLTSPAFSSFESVSLIARPNVEMYRKKRDNFSMEWSVLNYLDWLQALCLHKNISMGDASFMGVSCPWIQEVMDEVNPTVARLNSKELWLWTMSPDSWFWTNFYCFLINCPTLSPDSCYHPDFYWAIWLLPRTAHTCLSSTVSTAIKHH